MASASATGTSRVDGSNSANTDINVYTAATLPSGDIIGLTYYMDATNGTYTAPTLFTKYFLTNPGSFAVKGKAVAATQAVFNVTPAQVTFQNGQFQATELTFDYDVMNATQQYLVPNSSFTCTIFDGSTLIGSDTSTVGGTAGGGMTDAFAACSGVYPSNSGYTAGNGNAYVNLPATYNSGDTYTFIISQ